MTEDRIREIVREELAAVEREKAEAQEEADFFHEEMMERQRKREEAWRRYAQEEAQRLQDRVNELEWKQFNAERQR